MALIVGPGLIVNDVNGALVASDGMIFNGTTAGTGWAVSGSKAVGTNATGSLTLVSGSSFYPTNGSLYKITFDISTYTSGTVQLVFGGSTVGPTYSATGTYTYLVEADSTRAASNVHGLYGTGFNGQVDNLSIKEQFAVAGWNTDAYLTGPRAMKLGLRDGTPNIDLNPDYTISNSLYYSLETFWSFNSGIGDGVLHYNNPGGSATSITWCSIGLNNLPHAQTVDGNLYEITVTLDVIQNLGVNNYFQVYAGYWGDYRQLTGTNIVSGTYTYYLAADNTNQGAQNCLWLGAAKGLVGNTLEFHVTQWRVRNLGPEEEWNANVDLTLDNTLRQEYPVLVDPEFNDASKWTGPYSIAGGVLTSSNNSGNMTADMLEVLEAEKTYKYEYKVNSHTGGGVQLIIGGNPTGFTFGAGTFSGSEVTFNNTPVYINAPLNWTGEIEYVRVWRRNAIEAGWVSDSSTTLDQNLDQSENAGWNTESSATFTHDLDQSEVSEAELGAATALDLVLRHGWQMIPDPEFLDSSKWLVGSNWRIVGGQAIADQGDGSGDASRLGPINYADVKAGRAYRLRFTIVSGMPGGFINQRVGGTYGTAAGANGTFEEVIVAGADGDSSNTGLLDVISNAVVENFEMWEVGIDEVEWNANADVSLDTEFMGPSEGQQITQDWGFDNASAWDTSEDPTAMVVQNSQLEVYTTTPVAQRRTFVDLDYADKVLPNDTLEYEFEIANYVRGNARLAHGFYTLDDPHSGNGVYKGVGIAPDWLGGGLDKVGLFFQSQWLVDNWLIDMDIPYFKVWNWGQQLNPDFDFTTPSEWSSANWVVSGGQASITSASANLQMVNGPAFADQDLVRVSLNVVSTSGAALWVVVGGQAVLPAMTSPGYYEFFVRIDGLRIGNTGHGVTCLPGTITIDKYSLTKVDIQAGADIPVNETFDLALTQSENAGWSSGNSVTFDHELGGLHIDENQDPECDDPDSWFLSGGTTVSGGAIHFNAPSITQGATPQRWIQGFGYINIQLALNTRYKVVLTISNYVSGELTLYTGTTITSNTFSANGTYEFYLTTGSSYSAPNYLVLLNLSSPPTLDVEYFSIRKAAALDDIEAGWSSDDNASLKVWQRVGQPFEECSEQLPDPSFDDPFAWVDNPPSTEVTGGKLVLNNTSAQWIEATNNSPYLGWRDWKPNVPYECEVQISNYVSGSIEFSIGGAPKEAGPLLNSNGVYRFRLSPQTATGWTGIYSAPNTQMDVEYWSVKWPEPLAGWSTDATPYDQFGTLFNLIDNQGELVSDPDFDVPGDWDLFGTDILITGGELVATGSPSTARGARLLDTSGIKAGKTYLVKADIVTWGHYGSFWGLTVRVGGTTVAALSSGNTDFLNQHLWQTLKSGLLVTAGADGDATNTRIEFSGALGGGTVGSVTSFNIYEVNLANAGWNTTESAEFPHAARLGNTSTTELSPDLNVDDRNVWDETYLAGPYWTWNASPSYWQWGPQRIGDVLGLKDTAFTFDSGFEYEVQLTITDFNADGNVNPHIKMYFGDSSDEYILSLKGYPSSFTASYVGIANHSGAPGPQFLISGGGQVTGIDPGNPSFRLQGISIKKREIPSGWITNGAASLDLGLSQDELVEAITGAVVTLASQYGYTTTGELDANVIEAAVAFALQLTEARNVSVDYIAQVDLNQSLAETQAATINWAAQVALDYELGLTADVQAIIGANVALAQALGVDSAGTANIQAALTLGATLVDDPSAANITDAALTLTHELAQTDAALRQVNADLNLYLQLAETQDVQWDATPNVTLDVRLLKSMQEQLIDYITCTPRRTAEVTYVERTMDMLQTDHTMEIC